MLLKTVWVEIPVKNIERAAKFYGKVFEREYTISDDGTRKTTTLTDTSEAGVGFSLNETANFEPSDKGALVYLDCGEDLAPVLARVGNEGGKVVMPKTDMGGYGFYAMFQDCEGNVLALYSAK
jgi:hypothetical protein